MAEKHVRYGGSNCPEWLHCAGYATLSQQVPRKVATVPMIEGTAQHKCMELMLLDPELMPEKFLGTTVMEVVIRQDHVDALNVALNAYQDIVDSYPDGSVLLAEQFVGLDSPDDEEAGGTMDAGIVAGDRAAIIDFKFGQIEVDASGEQNLFYATCARKTLPAFAKVKELTSYIIQPAYDPAIDKTVYPEGILDRFETEVRTAIAVSKAPNPHFTEGDWCTWCVGKLACPAKTQRLATLTAPNHVLDLEELQRQLLKLKSWDKWREEAEGRIQHELENGTPMTQWKLVAKRAIRQWIDETAAVHYFNSRKIPMASYMISKLISPAQAEKLIPKAEVAKLASPVSSGNTIAPMDDKRPAVLSAIALGQALKRRM